VRLLHVELQQLGISRCPSLLSFLFFSFFRLAAAASRFEILDLKIDEIELNLPGLVVTMWRAAARGKSPFAAARQGGARQGRAL